MMKPWVVLILLSLLGFACGLSTMHWNSAFMSTCGGGEDCTQKNLGVLLEIALGEAVLFSIAGCLFKVWRSRWRFFIGVISFTLITVLSSYGVYEYKLSKYGISSNSFLVDQDYSHVVVAMKSIPGLNITEGDRCSLGTAFCDELPKFIEAHCKGKALKITENDWPSFKRLPEEDFLGIPPDLALYRDFPDKVCATSSSEEALEK
jgi:hypothetical protein